MNEPNENDFPELRNPDVIPLQSSGRQMVALRDRQGLSDQTVVVDEEIFYLKYVESIDSEGFYTTIKDDANRRGICAYYYL